MAYTYLPVTTSTQINLWRVVKELVLGAVERGQAANGDPCVYPHSSYEGWIPDARAITAATETTITVNHTWCGGTDDVSGNIYTNPWGCVTIPFYEAPGVWYVVVDSDEDAVACIKIRIASWTNTGVITVAATPNGLRDYVTSKRIPSIASLVGRKAYIIRGDYGIWWHERIMPWPNPKVYAKGVVIAYNDNPLAPATVTNPTLTTLKQANDATKWVDWRPNTATTTALPSDVSFVAKEILFYGEDGYLKRAAISKNTKDTLTFATSGSKPAVGSTWIVVDAGAVAEPNRTSKHIFDWYSGVKTQWATHMADDTSGTFGLPSKVIHLNGAVSSVCTGRDSDTFDVDVWTEQSISPDDQICSRPADKCYSPYLFQSFRGIDKMIYDACPSYVEAKSYDASTAIPKGNAALFFKLAGVNSYTGTTGSVYLAVGNDGSTNNEILISGISLPYYPIQVDYCIVRSDPGVRGDDYYKAGRGVMLDATHLVANPDETNNFTQQDDSFTPSVPGDNAHAIYMTPGFTRFAANQFKRMYNIDGVFVPDIHTDISLTKTVIDPAHPDVFDNISNSCYGVGTYYKRGKSTNYILRKQENSSYRSPQGYGWEAGGAFAEGDIARYIGDNAQDPTVMSGTSNVDSTSNFDSTGSVIDKYLERNYVGGTANDANRIARSVQLSGAATSAGTFYIKDTSKNWFDHQWFNGKTRTDSGTATSGSTTSLTDSSKVDGNPSSPTVIGHCYWLASRFIGFSGPYVGFTVEIDIPNGTGGTTTHKRMITSGNETTVTISWADPLPSTASGMVYRIKEPYYLNRWKDRTLTITALNGTRYTTTILGNCEDTLYFTPIAGGIVPLAGWFYEIIDPKTGGVWKYTSGKWVELTGGADAIRQGVTTAANFHANSCENLPGYKKYYGRFMLGDSTRSLKLYNERYALLNVLRHLKDIVSWTARADDAVAENNYELETASATTGSGIGAWEASAMGRCLALWGTLPSENSARPYARAVCQDDSSIGCVVYSIGRRCGYALVTGICSREATGVDYYVFAENPGSAPTAACNNGVAFSAEGDSVAYQLWKKFASVSAAVRTTDRQKLGSLTAPTGSYCGVQSTAGNVTGYDVVDECCIKKMDGTGGFKYIA